MHDMLPAATDARVIDTQQIDTQQIDTGGCVRLSGVKPGDRGEIIEVRADHANDHGIDVHELERRLLEFGFVEGARFEVLHQGAIWRDPLAIRLDDLRVALRRRDAEDVWVRLDE